MNRIIWQKDPQIRSFVIELLVRCANDNLITTEN